MQRAARIFAFEEAALKSPFVEKIWRTRSEPVDAFISVAVVHWEIVVTRVERETFLTVRGPETRATSSPIPQNASFFGVQFPPGTFMPDIPIALADQAVMLPNASRRSFWLKGSAWQFPSYDNADVFVNRLVRKGMLVRDPIVDAVLRGDVTVLSRRSVERRVLRATGLTLGAIRQIERANAAVELLENGATILDAVQHLGYADQPHLTRSLRRFIGQTPAEIVGFVQDRGHATAIP